MKLAEHIKKIKELTYNSFNNQFSRLGIGVKQIIDKDKLPQEVQSERASLDQILQNHLDETGTYEKAREKVLDELTFTLFNRIAAIKVMEARMLFPEIITKRPEHGARSFGHKAWLEENPDMRDEELEGIRQFLIDSFNKLGDTISLYHQNYPYAFLPYVIELNEIIDTFNQIELDTDTGVDVWKSDDILGWLYESYNLTKKQEHKDSKAKTEYDKVSLQSQVYTPRWVVQFLVDNSLGKLYLEMYPDSEIKNKYKIANAPETRVRDIKPLHEIKLLDPASGSGNFLLYAFDFFYDLYVDQIENYGADYSENDIAELIIKNNIHGIDLDIRAIQLAQLGLFIKAKSKRRNVKNLQFNVVSSDFYLPDYTDIKYFFESGEELDDEQKGLVEEIWSDLKKAYMFGSLIRIEEKLNAKLETLYERQKTRQLDLFVGIEISKFAHFKDNFFKNLEKAVEKFSENLFLHFLLNNTKDAITFLKILTSKYDIVTANPPYTDSSDFGDNLRNFIDANYQKPEKFQYNLYSCFLKRSSELLNKEGKLGIIHPSTFMYLSSFEDMRTYILNNFHINLFIEFDIGGVFSSVDVEICCYLIENKNTDKKSFFMNLKKYKGYSNKKDIFLNSYSNLLQGIDDKHNYKLSQLIFTSIKSNPFIYWISSDFREKFSKFSLEDVLKVCQGLATGDNSRFLRFWWEIGSSNISTKYQQDKKKWVLYAKGGAFNKWQGNLWLVVNWDNNGFDIKNFRDNNGKQRSRPQNESFYFKEGITYSASGRGGYAFRYLPENSIFDVGGSSIFLADKYNNIYYVLAFLNSKLSFYIADCLNPTANLQVGDLKRVPFVIPEKSLDSKVSELSKQNVELTKYLLEFSIFEIDFKINPIVLANNSNNINDLRQLIKIYLDFENLLKTKVLINEAIVDNSIFEIYQLSENDKKMVVEKEGVIVGNLPISNLAKENILQSKISEFELNDFVISYINSLPEIEYSEQEFLDLTNEVSRLYLKNTDLEEICFSLNINPIELLNILKNNSLLPERKVNNFSKELIIQIVREVLLEKDDGIVSLVNLPGEKSLSSLVFDKLIEKGFTTTQISNFKEILGKDIDPYLENNFLEDESNIFNLFRNLPSTPFIWHITSGLERGFDAYIIIYKWNRDKLMLLKSVYVEKRERALMNRQSDLAEDNSAKAQAEKDKIYKQLNEIKEFKAKIDDLLESGYDPILDDGVGKNIAPLQKRKMIAYEVLNAGQLEKYLNADW